MILALVLALSPASAKDITQTDVLAAIAIINVSDAETMKPKATTVMLPNANGKPTRTKLMVNGKGLPVQGCTGYPDAFITYFSDPSGTLRILSVGASIDGAFEVMADGDLDGVPDMAVIAEGAEKPIGADERKAFVAIVLCLTDG